MNTPAQIIDTLGVKAIAHRLELAERRVMRAKYDGQLPASWYLALNDLAGCELPREAFSFKGVK